VPDVRVQSALSPLAFNSEKTGYTSCQLWQATTDLQTRSLATTRLYEKLVNQMIDVFGEAAPNSLILYPAVQGNESATWFVQKHQWIPGGRWRSRRYGSWRIVPRKTAINYWFISLLGFGSSETALHLLPCKWLGLGETLPYRPLQKDNSPPSCCPLTFDLL